MAEHEIRLSLLAWLPQGIISPKPAASGAEPMNRTVQIEKGLSTEVLALMADRQEIRGRFFLADHAQYHFGPENLLDILNNSGKRFAPFAQDGVSAVVLIQKSQIAGLQPSHADCNDWPPTQDDDPQCWQRAKIVFAGFSLKGNAYIGDMHPNRRGLADLLNHGNPFFVFDTD
ncbi:MAG: hypothetical protein KAH56_02015, partial [Candidatus Krumholzibacteria bacterium]|nr:hypothetical protein [Candidatus Krumholzibacteria bacterium]